jgi:hypothetical protein
LLADETEGSEKLADEFRHSMEEKNFDKAISVLYSRMSKMSEKMTKMDSDAKAYMAENEELRKFKAGFEEKQFKLEVDSTLKDLEECLPEKEMDALRMESEKFSLETIEGWKNAARAKAFLFSKEKKPSDNITKIGLPFSGVSGKKSGSLWG